MNNSISMVPIGIVHSTGEKPIDDVWGGLISRIDLDTSRFAPESLAGLDEFSHVEIVFAFHQVGESEIESAAGILADARTGRRSGSSPSVVRTVRTGLASPFAG